MTPTADSEVHRVTTQVTQTTTALAEDDSTPHKTVANGQNQKMFQVPFLYTQSKVEHLGEKLMYRGKYQVKYLKSNETPKQVL